MIRIVGGMYRGFKLEEVPLKTTRPTQDKVRQAVFNMLFEIKGSVLDLFAGTGAYGLEALSRGANQVVLVDNERRAIQTMIKNVSKMDESKVDIKLRDYDRFLKQNDILFDLIFLDPPYNFRRYEALINNSLDHLKEEGKIILEVDSDTFIKETNDYKLVKRAIYGNKKILIIQKERWDWFLTFLLYYL